MVNRLISIDTSNTPGSQLPDAVVAEIEQIVNVEPEVYTNFAAKINGAVELRSDSGHDVALLGSRAAAYPPVIYGAALVNYDTTAGATSSWYEVEVEDSITFLSMDVTFGSTGSTAGGYAVIAALVDLLPQTNGLLTSPIPDSPCYLVCSTTGYEVSVYQGGMANKVVLGTVTYPTAFAYSDVQHVEVVIDAARDVIYVLDPTGSIAKYSSSYISDAAPAVVVAVGVGSAAGNTDHRGAVRRFSADTTPVRDSGVEPFGPARMLYLSGHMINSPFQSMQIATIKDVNGKAAISTSAAASAVNNVVVGNAAAGAAPSVGSTGTDTDVDLSLATKGLGQVLVNGVVIPQGFATTATNAGTATLTIRDKPIQVFTGTTTHTVKLPTTGVMTGQRYIVINASTGAVTVQSSGANTIIILAAGTSAEFTALVATPTTAANWHCRYHGGIIASGKSLSVSNTLTLAGTDGTTMTFPSGSATVAGLATAQTLTATRIQPRIGTVTSSSTPTASADNHDQYNVTALAAGATFGAPTGTPVDGQKLLYRIKDNGGAQTLAWNGIFRAVGVTAPTTTVGGKTLYVGTIYNSATPKWDIVATALEA